ncbi:MAG TPA: hypothetical protein VGG85_03730 [Terracidiphilus sp.]
MSENLLKEERPVDEGITTATLAGLGERPTLRKDKDFEQREEQRDFDRMGEEAEMPRDDRRTSLAVDPLATATPAVANGQASNGKASEEQTAPLFPSGEATELRSRWDAIQVGFVDEPRHAVEQADALVAGAMKRMAEIFAEERGRLEGQWDRGDSVSTEDLRLALRRYRSFFGRVLSV